MLGLMSMEMSILLLSTPPILSAENDVKATERGPQKYISPKSKEYEETVIATW